MHTLQFDRKALLAADAAQAATSKSATMLRKEFTAGGANALQVLLAQQSSSNALLMSAKARADLYADTAALFQALGGGWWNRSDVHPVRKERDAFSFL